jgi:hypothetical protein
MSSALEHDHTVSSNHGARTTTNWVLAALAVHGAIAVVGYAYARVLGTAACTGGACGGLGPSELGFSLILYGTPIVAVVGVVVSFLTAKHRWGIVVPAISWAVIALALITLVVTF